MNRIRRDGKRAGSITLLILMLTLSFTIFLVFNGETKVYAVSSPALDGSVAGSGGTGTVSSLAVTLTTTQTNDVIYVAVSIRTSGVTVSSITSTGLTFTKRASENGGTGSGGIRVETWYAKASSTISQSITVNLSGSASLTVIAFGISGADFASPFDPNSGALAAANTDSQGSTTTTTPSVQISTTNANDFIIGALVVQSTGVSVTTGTGCGAGSFTQIQTTQSAGSASTTQEGASEYCTVSATQTNFAVGFTLASAQYWAIIADAVQAPVAQPITVTMSNSAPSATVAFSACNPSPSTFSSDGAPHTINMDPSCSFTLSFSNAGNARDGFSVSSAFSATSSTQTTCVGGTCSTVSLTAYLQLQNTYQVTANAQSTFDTGMTWTITGTLLGTASSTVCTISSTAAATDSCVAFADFNTAVSFPSSAATPPANSRWQVSGTSSFTQTTGGNTNNVNYYKQWTNNFAYSVTGGGSPTPPTLTCNQLGTGATLTLTTSAQSFFCDNGASATATNPTTGSTSSERWTDNAQSFTITSGGASNTFAYNHQFFLTGTPAPGSVGNILNGNTWQNSGASVQVSASPNSNWNFQYWTGTGSGSFSGTTNPATITMNGPITQAATFQYAIITLDASVSFFGSSTSSTVKLNHAANVLVVVAVSIAGDSNTVASVTVAGTPATQLSSVDQANTVRDELWYVYLASSGNDPVTVTLTSGSPVSNVAWVAASFTGTVSTAPFFEGTNTNKVGGAPSVNVQVTGPGRVIIQSIGTSNCPYANPTVSSLGSGQVPINSGNVNAVYGCNSIPAYMGSYNEANFLQPASIGSNTLTATLNAGGAGWASIGTAIIPAVAIPTITLSPSQGIVSSSVTVSGIGFTPAATVTVTFNGSPVSTSPSTVTVASTGAFTASFTVPSIPNGLYTVQASGSDSPSDSGSLPFLVTAPAITLNPTSGLSGSTVTISGTGYEPGFTVTVKFNGNPVTTTPSTITGSSTGTFTATFTVPNTSPATYQVTADGGALPFTIPSSPFIVTPTAPSTTPTLDNSIAFSGSSTTSTVKLNHAANVLVVVAVSIAGDSNTVASVTVAGTPATQLSSVDQANTVRDELWYVYLASSGNDPVTVTLTSGSPVSNVAWVAASFTGTVSTAPFFEGTNKNTGWSNSASVGVNVQGLGRVVLEFIGTGNCPSQAVSVSSLGSGQTGVTSAITPAGSGCGTVNAYSSVYGEVNTMPGTIGTVNPTGTLSGSSSWASIGAAILPAQAPVSPSLTVSPIGGVVGTSVTVSGTGYKPSVTATVTFNGGTVASSVPVSASGSFTATFTVPNVPLGTYTVQGTGSDSPSDTASATFKVTSSNQPLTPTLDAAVTFQGEASTSSLKLNHAASVLVVVWVSIAGDANTVQSVTVGVNTASQVQTPLDLKGIVRMEVWGVYVTAANNDPVTVTLSSPSPQPNIVWVAASFTGTTACTLNPSSCFEGANMGTGFSSTASTPVNVQGTGRLVVQFIGMGSCPYQAASVTSLGSGQTGLSSGAAQAIQGCGGVPAYAAVYGEVNIMQVNSAGTVTPTGTLSGTISWGTLATAILP